VLGDPINLLDPYGEVSWPTDYATITSPFGASRSGGPHKGLDIENPRDGLVYATDGGRVRSVYYDEKGGNQIIIDNDDGSVSGYAHTKATVVPGEKVPEGLPLGYSDGSGKGITGPHLHYTYRPCKDCEKIDPLPRLRGALVPRQCPLPSR